MILARYVEVNYVRAKVVGSGVCVKNGIVHKVDQILGIPGRTIYQEIAENTDLRRVADHSGMFLFTVTEIVNMSQFSYSHFCYCNYLASK